MQFGINEHSQIFQRPQIALALRACAILLTFEKFLVLIYYKLHSKSCDYLYKFDMDILKKSHEKSYDYVTLLSEIL